MSDFTPERIQALLDLAERHGFTLTNGGDDAPVAEPVLRDLPDAHMEDGEPEGWDLYVADHQVVVHVPRHPYGSGEPSDGGPLTDWRDAICESGRALLDLRQLCLELQERVADLEEELKEAREAEPSYLEAEDEPASFSRRHPDGVCHGCMGEGLDPESVAMDGRFHADPCEECGGDGKLHASAWRDSDEEGYRHRDFPDDLAGVVGPDGWTANRCMRCGDTPDDRRSGPETGEEGERLVDAALTAWKVVLDG